MLLRNWMTQNLDHMRVKILIFVLKKIMEGLVHLVQEVVEDQDLDPVHQGGTEALQHIHLYEEHPTLALHPGLDHDLEIVINKMIFSSWLNLL